MASVNFVVFGLLMLVGASVSQTANYCTLSTCTSGTNTLCKYTSTTWGSSCVSASDPGITDAEKTQIVSLHNEYRRKVAKGLETRGLPGPQPQASNMRQLVWDAELATMAQTHAQQCQFAHDTCRNVDRFRVGQNIYISMSTASITTSNWSGPTTSWSDEVQYMNTTSLQSFPSSQPKVIGHYTQMVWATTTTVGCGVVGYQVTGDKFPYRRLYVCNYGPTGNWLNSPVYSQGTAGSACPSGTTNSDGLCA